MSVLCVGSDVGALRECVCRGVAAALPRLVSVAVSGKSEWGNVFCFFPSFVLVRVTTCDVLWANNADHAHLFGTVDLKIPTRKVTVGEYIRMVSADTDIAAQAVESNGTCDSEHSEKSLDDQVLYLFGTAFYTQHPVSRHNRGSVSHLLLC